ncbi:protein-S-isoprenylcysteine O-methyltransferase [Neocloeon triangulifer]|uniref:protein-S-isoprenylcysteine O-methyltransferase n=1 Tax=Neocloeon triangulifer TaxID=2078957 RepID=UPI00286F2C1D|nr:protein-S-isoprenylcysteine O-methyltransferase [Neocloeon triangulifer]
MTVSNAHLSLTSFLLSGCLSLLAVVSLLIDEETVGLVREYTPVLILANYVLVNLYYKLFYQGYHYQIAVRATFLGTVFSTGCLISVFASLSWMPLGLYMIIMAIFHFSEFLVTALVNARTLSLDSFLLNHSKEYGIAALASWIEFFLERWLLPEMKELWLFLLVGVVFCTAGEVLRKAAMMTAKTNFNHIVQSVREDGHQLVTHGVYGLCRHPSYVGWFIWSIGTQLVLLNPLCLLAYTMASWKFFQTRVLIEEVSLLNFFGDQYYEYQQKVPTGLPFIKGYM